MCARYGGAPRSRCCPRPMARACPRRCSKRPPAPDPLVPPRDIAGLAAAIAALAGDPARRRRLGEGARALVERAFAEPIVIRDTLALYREALRERTRR